MIDTEPLVTTVDPEEVTDTAGIDVITTDPLDTTSDPDTGTVWSDAMLTAMLFAMVADPLSRSAASPSAPMLTFIRWCNAPLTKSAATVAPVPGVTSKLSAILHLAYFDDPALKISFN
jgi:hypothetical protein